MAREGQSGPGGTKWSGRDKVARGWQSGLKERKGPERDKVDREGQSSPGGSKWPGRDKVVREQQSCPKGYKVIRSII